MQWICMPKGLTFEIVVVAICPNSEWNPPWFCRCSRQDWGQRQPPDLLLSSCSCRTWRFKLSFFIFANKISMTIFHCPFLSFTLVQQKLIGIAESAILEIFLLFKNKKQPVDNQRDELDQELEDHVVLIGQLLDHQVLKEMEDFRNKSHQVQTSTSKCKSLFLCLLPWLPREGSVKVGANCKLQLGGKIPWGRQESFCHQLITSIHLNKTLMLFVDSVGEFHQGHQESFCHQDTDWELMRGLDRLDTHGKGNPMRVLVAS